MEPRSLSQRLQAAPQAVSSLRPRGGGKTNRPPAARSAPDTGSSFRRNSRRWGPSPFQFPLAARGVPHRGSSRGCSRADGPRRSGSENPASQPDFEPRNERRAGYAGIQTHALEQVGEVDADRANVDEHRTRRRTRVRRHSKNSGRPYCRTTMACIPRLLGVVEWFPPAKT
jgi:hypothetical protein